MSVKITSNPDDSVTLEAHGFNVKISATTWKEANEAAHLLAEAAGLKKELTKTRWKLEDLIRKLTDFRDTLSDVNDSVKEFKLPYP